MKRMKLNYGSDLTFKDGCEKYIENCRQRNLREGTINHYKQSYKQFYKHINPDMLLNDFTEDIYNDYIATLCNTLSNDISINAYLRDLITTIHFLQSEGYVQPFKMKSIKTDKNMVETYTDDELKLLLAKSNLKKASFTEYQCWVISNFLFSTGVRQRSLMNIKVKDLDLVNGFVYVKVTKNRKPLIIPLNQSMFYILKDFLKYRQFKTTDDYLFCNVYGQQLTKSTSYHQLYWYNKNRGVETTGLHRYRHTFAKQWILNGGNVVSLQKILGHSSLSITQNYINLLVSDVQKEVDEIDLINKFSDKCTHRIKLNKE